MTLSNRLLLTAATLLVLSAGLAQAQTQTNYSIGSGSVSYTAPNGVSPEPNILGTTGYVFDVVTPNATAPATATVTGVSIHQTDSNSLGLLIDNYAETYTPMSVTFQGAASSVISANDGLLVYDTGFHTSGDVSLNTTGTVGGGNTFSAADHGNGVDVEDDQGTASTATVTLGADTISSVNGDGLRVYSGSGSAIVTSAANISGGYYGIEVSASQTLSVTVSGTVTGGSQGSILMDNYNSSSSTLALQTGANLVGTAYGVSSDAIGNGGMDSNLILQGHGTTGNNFVHFNSVEVQNGGGGAWSLQGTSSFSGALKVDAGGALTQNAGSNSFASGTNAGSLTVAANTLTVTGNLENTGFVTIGSGAKLTVGSYTQDCAASCGTLINHGTLDPASIEIDSGTFGGAGTVIGDVTLNGATLQAGDAAGGNLAIDGSYAQTGGNIVFFIDPNGTGGFDVSSLTFTPGESLSLNGVDISFDFAGGADPLAFLHSGEFDLDSFFKSGSGDPFGADFDLATLFAGDTFSILAPGADVTKFDFDPGRGVLDFAETVIPGVPEPATWAMFLIGFGLIGWTLRRQTRTVRTVDESAPA